MNNKLVLERLALFNNIYSNILEVINNINEQTANITGCLSTQHSYGGHIDTIQNVTFLEDVDAYAIDGTYLSATGIRDNTCLLPKFMLDDYIIDVERGHLIQKFMIGIYILNLEKEKIGLMQQHQTIEDRIKLITDTVEFINKNS